VDRRATASLRGDRIIDAGGLLQADTGRVELAEELGEFDAKVNLTSLRN